MKDYVYCLECNPPRRFKQVTASHLKTHGLTSSEYKEKYPGVSLISEMDLDDRIVRETKRFEDSNERKRTGELTKLAMGRQEVRDKQLSGLKSRTKRILDEINDWVEERQGKYFCHCGCGQEIEIFAKHKVGGIPIYRRGHNLRVDHNMHNPEVVEKMRQTNTGSKRCPCSEERKRKIGMANTGSKNGMFGVRHTLESRMKSSATKQGISYDEWESFATNQEYCPEFDEVCRESNRDKYDRRCFLCDLMEIDNISPKGRQVNLSVHHVDMNKNQGCDGYKWKLVPLCMRCHRISHSKTWKSRVEWLLNNVYI